jgi:hypothetical protein
VPLPRDKRRLSPIPPPAGNPELDNVIVTRSERRRTGERAITARRRSLQARHLNEHGPVILMCQSTISPGLQIISIRAKLTISWASSMC